MSNQKRVYQRSQDKTEPEVMLMSSIFSDKNQEQLHQTKYAIRDEALPKTNGMVEWEKWFGMTDEQTAFVKEVLQKRSEFLAKRGCYPTRVYVSATRHGLLANPVSVASLEVVVMSNDSFMLE